GYVHGELAGPPLIIRLVLGQPCPYGPGTVLCGVVEQCAFDPVGERHGGAGFESVRVVSLVAQPRVELLVCSLDDVAAVDAEECAVSEHDVSNTTVSEGPA